MSRKSETKTPMRRFVCILAVLVIGGYLCAMKWDRFTQVDLAAVGRRPLYSDQVNLRETGPLVWNVPKGRWAGRGGKAKLSLSLNLHTLHEIPEDRSSVALRAKVRAEGRSPGGEWRDRLVRDWYYRTDEPFSKESALWESHGMGAIEYGLAGIQIEPEEELRITLDIHVPDEKLMLGYPRLKLVPDYDSVGVNIGWIVMNFVREGWFWLSIFLLLCLIVMAWRRNTKKESVAARPEMTRLSESKK
jgi:hypothetical protein